MSEAREPFRVAVAGVGFGAAVHVAGLRACGAEVVAIAAADRARAEDAASRLGIPAGCAGIDALLDRPLDAVTFALPPDANPAAVEAAVARGLAILSEKPLAPGGAEARRLAEAAGGLVTAVDFEFAELTTFRALADLVKGESLGAVRDVRVTWLVESWAQKNRKWSWKTDARRGGGVVGVLATHLLYLAEWLFGPAGVAAAALENRATARFALAGETAAAESATLDLRLPGGVPMHVEVSNAAAGKHLHRWEVTFENGAAVLENDSADYMAGFRLERAGQVLTEPATDGDGRLPPFVRLADRFVSAARSGGACLPDFAAGARVQELVDDIHRAAA